MVIFFGFFFVGIGVMYRSVALAVPVAVWVNSEAASLFTLL